MLPIVPVLLIIWNMCGQAPAQESKAPAQLSEAEYKKLIASYPPNQQVYELWRYWVFHQPPDVQKLFNDDSTKEAGFALYRKVLERNGDDPSDCGHARSWRRVSLGFAAGTRSPAGRVLRDPPRRQSRPG